MEQSKDTIIIINDTSNTNLVKKYELDKLDKVNEYTIVEIKKEIIDLKKDIHEIKNVMKEMAILMKSIYLFEYQPLQMKD
jgi:hypothetical protein